MSVGLVGKAIFARIDAVMRNHPLEQRLGPHLVLPTEQIAQPRDAEGDAVIIVRQAVQQVERPHVDEAAPVETLAEARERVRAHRRFEQPGLLQRMESGDVIIDAPGVVGVVDREVRDLTIAGEIFGQARIAARVSRSR